MNRFTSPSLNNVSWVFLGTDVFKINMKGKWRRNSQAFLNNYDQGCIFNNKSLIFILKSYE